MSLGQSVKLRPFGVRSVAAMCLFNSNSYKSDGTPEVLVSSYLQGGVSHVKEHVVYCGIDVAKGQLDGALLGKRWQVPNTKAGIRRLIKMLRQRNTCPQVICEASGGYEQDLVELLLQAAVPVTLVQPQRCTSLHGPAASWPKPIRSTRRCWCALAKRSRPRPMQLQGPKHSYCANWIDSALISAAS